MNQQIVIATVLIAGSGIATAWIGKKPITPVIMGAYIFMALMALLDMFGGVASQLAGAFATLVMIAVVVNTGLPLLQAIGGVKK